MRYVNHPGIKTITNQFPNNRFSFKQVTKSDIRKEIINLNSAKASHDSDTAAKLVKQNTDIYTDVLQSTFNNYLENAIFPLILKTADAIPIFKKENRTDKSNYGPISILPNISNISERCMCQEISSYFEENIFSKYQCGFREIHIVQHSLSFVND